MPNNKRRVTLRQRLSLLSAAFFPDFAGDRTPGGIGPGWTYWGGHFKNDAGQIVNPATALGLPAVFACVRVLKDTIGPIPVRLVKTSADGKSTNIVTDHPVADLLREPNTPAGIGMPTLLKDSQTAAQLLGNDYFQIERGTGGDPIRLWHLDPGDTSPLITAQVGLAAPRGILAYRTRINGTLVDLPPADVIHIRDMSLNGIQGMSKVRLAANAIGAGLAMEQYVGNFFKNDATSGGYFVHPGKLSSTAKVNLVDSVVDQTKAPAADGAPASSRREHFRPKVLEEGIKWIQTTVAPESAQLNESRERALAECARVWGVPLMLVQAVSGSTVWGTGIEQLLIGFTQLTILPIIVDYEDEMSRKLLTMEERRDGYAIKFDLTHLLRGDAKSRAEVNAIMLQNGAYTRNEVRQEEGKNPLPDLDQPLVPSTMVDPSKPPPAPTTPFPPKAEPDAPPVPPKKEPPK